MTNGGASGGMFQDGPGFVAHEHHRIVEVTGSDARGWLNDLVTGPVGTLSPGRATRSLLLTPTGRIRADFTVADAERLTLLQDRTQPHGIDGLLGPYVLSSDVELTDASERFALFSLPGREEPPELPATEFPRGARAFAPSALGPGIGLIAERSAAAKVTGALESAAPPASEEALDLWRIELGIPRMGVDFHESAFPAEAGLEEAIDFTKGCFLGQESVAKIRNLGHPPTVLLALQASEPVAAGDAVRAGGADVGTITSSAISPGETLLLAVVRWEARDGALMAAEATPLTPRARWSPPQT